MNTKGKIYTVIFTFIIAFLFVLALSVVNHLLHNRLTRNADLARNEALLRAMGIPFEGHENSPAVFTSAVSYLETPAGLDAAGDEYYEAVVDGQTVYAAVARGRGLWGTITFVLAVNQDATRIIGLDVISHSETPGLGGRIDEPWFKQQFRGETLSADGRIALAAAGTGDADHANGAVDAITGASITSRLFTAMVNDTLSRLRRVVAAGGRRRTGGGR